MKLDVLLNKEMEQAQEAQYEEPREVVHLDDLAVAKAQFAAITALVDRITTDAEAIEITDDDRLNYAVAVTGECRKVVKAFEAKRKEVTANAEGFIKSVRGFVGQFTDRLEDAAKCVQQKIVAYRSAVELKRREQEALARKAAADMQKKLNAQAKKAGVEAPEVPVPIVPAQKTAVRTESGTTAYEVKRWICTVIDAGAVPREYCEPAKKLLDEAVRIGVREIPGCKIEEVTDIRFRT